LSRVVGLEPLEESERDMDRRDALLLEARRVAFPQVAKTDFDVDGTDARMQDALPDLFVEVLHHRRVVTLRGDRQGFVVEAETRPVAERVFEGGEIGIGRMTPLRFVRTPSQPSEDASSVIPRRSLRSVRSSSESTHASTRVRVFPLRGRAVADPSVRQRRVEGRDRNAHRVGVDGGVARHEGPDPRRAREADVHHRGERGFLRSVRAPPAHASAKGIGGRLVVIVDSTRISRFASTSLRTVDGSVSITPSPCAESVSRKPEKAWPSIMTMTGCNPQASMAAAYHVASSMQLPSARDGGIREGEPSARAIRRRANAEIGNAALL
jgi:hypothetical protein